MPLCTLHIIQLRDPSSLPAFLATVSRKHKLIWAGKVFEPVVYDGDLDREKLLKTPWTCAVLVDGGVALDTEASRAVKELYTVAAGVPSRILQQYPTLNPTLFGPPPPRHLTEKPHIAPDSSKLQLSKPMLEYQDRVEKTGYKGPVSQINLLCFHQTEGAKESYGKYGAGFVKVGGRHGGNAKIVGNVVPPPEGQSDSRKTAKPTGKWWNEIAIAQYPTFTDMPSDPAYQEINQSFRVPALDSTIILSTRDIRPDDPEAQGIAWAKL